MEYLVRLVTPPNGIVLDPFLGSGTTAMACKAEGFNFIGIERESDYIKIAEARINSVQEKLKL
jgi:site-specific DNA-methyltransferase (adenine-specific)